MGGRDLENNRKYYISVIIPLFNEADSIVELYSMLILALGKISEKYELIFVDDGSTDGSLGIIRKLRDKDTRVKIISFNRNYGKSPALSEGFEAAKGDIVVTIDADLQDNPDEIPGMIEKLDQGYDLVSGWKKYRKDPITKTLPSRVFNFFTAMITGIKLHDINCGLKVYRREVIKRIHVYGELHRVIPVLAGWEGFRIGEQQVSHFERKYGHSKYGMKRFLNGIFDLTTVMFITRRSTTPLHFFGRIAVFFFGVGGLINLYFLLQWIFGKGLHVRPLMVGGLVMLVIAVQIASIGLLAELFSSNLKSTYSYREYLIDD
ncbi:MAG: glycosyltransferase family 2 protein [Candidatus Krumholzibacteriota bacterium]|nr:glycosyltransferase family 2 protein [Candidatus Krumholzibacteriota bacterium]